MAPVFVARPPLPPGGSATTLHAPRTPRQGPQGSAACPGLLSGGAWVPWHSAHQPGGRKLSLGKSPNRNSPLSLRPHCAFPLERCSQGQGFAAVLSGVVSRLQQSLAIGGMSAQSCTCSHGSRPRCHGSTRCERNPRRPHRGGGVCIGFRETSGISAADQGGWGREP